jgi:hypothetical protein
MRGLPQKYLAGSRSARHLLRPPAKNYFADSALLAVECVDRGKPIRHDPTRTLLTSPPIVTQLID